MQRPASKGTTAPAAPPGAREIALAACAFRRPPRIPRIENFWNATPEWTAAFGPLDALSDVVIRVPDETFFPSRAREIRKEEDYAVRVDGWGRTLRARDGAYFTETLDVALPDGKHPDDLVFDAPDLDSRFARPGLSHADTLAEIESEKRRYCLFGKTGGPFLRSCFLRGEEQFLLDMAGDPPLARAIADKVGDHLTAVGVEEIRRWGLQDTGIWIYDDMGSNRGPVFRPDSFETVLLPAFRRMIRAYKEAGARYVFLHSDGNILPVLDMLVDAGIEGLNPLESRAGMDLVQVHKRYPRLVLTGGMDNTDTLRNGPAERIAAEARAIIDAGRDGGVIIGTHSIGPEIPLEHYRVYHETCLAYGQFA